MKVPLRWLRDYVDPQVPVGELARRLTLAGLEVTGARVLGLEVPEGLRVRLEEPERRPTWDRDKILVAQLVKVEPHPNADKLKLPTVDYGQGRLKKMVTGAPNISIGDSGQKVVLGMAGSIYRDGHVSPPALKELKPAKVRGEPSDAMVMSTFELGIDEEHEGIILLDADAPVGMPLADYLGDVVLEVDVLPNMARCLSMIGVAREVSAITGQPLKLPAPASPRQGGEAIAGQVEVAIADARLSARYAAMLIKGIKVGPGPQWMQYRLTCAGMRPISNVVDITNYVMLEWGQPLHAFDYDVLRRRAGGKVPKITVRPAREGETLKTLDGQDRKLTPDMLLITDDAGPIALAGIMGGAETEVSAKTTNVLLESASFNYVSIRRTMRALNLPSEASARFSRGVPPALVQPAAERAADLMRQYAGGTVCRGLVDCYPAPPPIRVVELKRSEVRRILGIDLALDECAALLRRLDYHVKEIGGELIEATVPEHRLDIQEGAADLIEDLARLHGYDRLPATLLADQLPSQANNDALLYEERTRDLLVSLGLQEAITHSLTTEEKEGALKLPKRERIKLLNPVTTDRTVMRQTLLAGLLDALQENLKHTNDVRLFEIGSVYLPREGQRLPEEPRCLGLALCGRRQPEFWADAPGTVHPSLDFSDLKGIVEELAESLHLAEVRYEQAVAPFLHPARTASLMVRGGMVGSFGELHPRVAAEFKLADRVVLVGEFDLDAMRKLMPARYLFTPISRFEAALRDVAVIVDESVTAEQVAGEIRAAGGDLLRCLRLFDVYRGEAIGAGKKSLAYALTYQAGDRTLADKEIDRAHRKIEERLKQVLKAQIRGKDTEK
jgi:phenylalanyl-tRNA synthetase beta chain